MTAMEEVAIYEIIQFPSHTKRHDKLAVVVAFDSREKLGVRARCAFFCFAFFVNFFSELQLLSTVNKL